MPITFDPGKFTPGSYPASNIIYNPGPRPAFSPVKPKEPAPLNVAKLGTANFNDILLRFIEAHEDLHVPADGSSITLGQTRFDMGDYIVEVPAAVGLSPHFRHVTEEEAQTYGLSSPK